MENSQKTKFRNRQKRKLRVRSSIRGNSAKPRLSVIRTNAHIHVQLIDDEKGTTLASTSTLSKEFRGSEHGRKNVSTGKQIGLKVAELAKAKNINTVVFDRGPCKYHGVVAAVADGAREGGLEL